LTLSLFQEPGRMPLKENQASINNAPARAKEICIFPETLLSDICGF